MSALRQNTAAGVAGEECQRSRLNSNTLNEIPSDTKGPYQTIQSSSETTLQYPGCGMSANCISQSANCLCVHQKTRSAKHPRATASAISVSTLISRDRVRTPSVIYFQTSLCLRRRAHLDGEAFLRASEARGKNQPSDGDRQGAQRDPGDFQPQHLQSVEYRGI